MRVVRGEAHCRAYKRPSEREDVVSDEEGKVIRNYLQEPEPDDPARTWPATGTTDPDDLTDG